MYALHVYEMSMMRAGVVDHVHVKSDSHLVRPPA